MNTLRRKLLRKPPVRPPSESGSSGTSTQAAAPNFDFPDGIEVLHDCPDATVDVCFVHGLTGDRNSTWTAAGQSQPWPKTLLPPKLGNARILTYGYDAYVTKIATASVNRLVDHATNFLNDLTTDRRSANASSRALIFVAHSLGGLVCKEAILLSRNNPDAHLRNIFSCTKGIIFLGTPHKGSWIANWAKMPASALGFVKSTNKSLLNILETNDQLLEEIQLRFLAMIRELREGSRRFEVTCFFEELPLPVVGVVVSKESATLPPYNPISIHSTHSGMTKYASAGETGFKRVVGELTRWESEVSLDIKSHASTFESATLRPQIESSTMRGTNDEQSDTGLPDTDRMSNHINSRMMNGLRGLIMVPYARNPNFTGQEAFIHDLSAKLEVQDRHYRLALIGLGGIGKSQVALEYAYRRQDKSPETSIFWIHASNALRFEQDWLQIGLKAKIPGIDDPKQNTKELVQNWLISKESGTWLLIIDNADDIDMFFNPPETSANGGRPRRLIDFLPQYSKGSIIFTTRNKKAGVNFASPGGLFELPKMDPSDAERLLITNLKGNCLINSGTRELLELLDYLPLAISQAGSYIAANSISISTYLQLYNESEESKIELLNENFEDLGRDPETKNPVTTTWEISFTQIRKSDGLAADLLSSMACLDRQAIPFELLPVPSKASGIKVEKALGLLKAYSLITANSNRTFSMHRLVYLVTRYWLRLNGMFGEWTRSCLKLVSNKFPSGEYDTLDTCDSYLAHAQVFLDSEDDSTTDGLFRAQLAHKVSYYLRNRGLFTPAYEYATQAVRWRQTVLGLEDTLTLASMDNLGQVMHIQGWYEMALEMHTRTLKLYEKIAGPEHRDTLTSMNNLGRVIYRLDWKNEKAEELFRRALDLRIKNFGLEDRDTLASMSNLARLLHRCGKETDTVEKMHRHVLEARTKLLGPEHPKTLASMNNLAIVLWDQNRHDEAEDMHRKVLKLREIKLGPEHPDTLASIDNLALALHHREQVDNGAEGMHRLAAELRTKTLGPEHPNTLASINNLVITLYNRGKYDNKTEDIHRQLVELRQRVLGPEHPDTLATMARFKEMSEKGNTFERQEESHLAIIEGDDFSDGLQQDVSSFVENTVGLERTHVGQQPLDTTITHNSDPKIPKKRLHALVTTSGSLEGPGYVSDSVVDRTQKKPLEALSIIRRSKSVFSYFSEPVLVDTTNIYSRVELKRRRRRRAHNLVERRRRDNINERIVELEHLVPQHRLEDEKMARRRQSLFITPEDEKERPGKGEILNASVSWVRDLMWLLHLKLQQEQELRTVLVELGGTWPYEVSEEEKRMHTESTEAFQTTNMSDFSYSRPDTDERGRSRKRDGMGSPYSQRSFSASDRSDSG